MKCKNCKEEIKETYKVCPFCAFPVEKELDKGELAFNMLTDIHKRVMSVEEKQEQLEKEETETETETEKEEEKEHGNNEKQKDARKSRSRGFLNIF